MDRRLDFRVLGLLEVADAGRALELPQGKPRAVLGVLLVHANEVVSADRLIEDVWGLRAPATAAKSVHVYVSQLRRCLGAGVIETRSPGYELRLEAGQLDVHQFERLRDAATRGDAAAAAAGLREALAIWRGPPLADFTYEPFAQATIARLEELRLCALEERIEADLALGREAELVAELRSLISEHPLRDRPRGALMLALYRSGRQADALEVYRDGQRLLDEQLGLEPSPDLKSLQHKILCHDPSLKAGTVEIAEPEGRGAPDVANDADRHSRLRLLAPVAVAVAMAAIAAAVFVTHGGQGSVQAAKLVAADSVGVFEPHGARLVGQVPVATGPGPVAIAAGAVWAVSVDDDSLSRIDPATKAVVQRIRIGASPSGIAVGGGFVWVANSGDGSVSQVDPKTNAVVQTLAAGSQPSGVAYGHGFVWVANQNDRTVSRIDPTNSRTRLIAVNAGADGIAFGEGAVWVTSASAGAVSRIDPQTNRVVETINTGPGADAVITSGGAVWVANSQAGTVSRIDPSSDQVTATLPVGDGPSGIAISGNDVWVSNELSGTLTRIDAARSQVAETVRIGNRPEGVARNAEAMYVAVRTAGVLHRGGTLKVAVASSFWETYWPHSLEPTHVYDGTSGQILNMTNDGLTTYRHGGGSAPGIQIVPDLAISLPSPTESGRTYTFHLRPGIRYSSGALVRPGDIRRGIMRTLFEGGIQARFFAAIKGADECRFGICELAEGITTNRAEGTITFHLVRPDPSFLYELATAPANALPEHVPEPPKGQTWAPLPATGPYMIARFSQTRRVLRLVRNPYFHEWSAAAQPAGYPDAIVVRGDRPDGAQLRAVERGKADFYTLGTNISAAAVRTLQIQHASQLHASPTLNTNFYSFNMSTPPFNDRRVRRAVNYAWDRNRAPELEGGRLRYFATCQVLPPNLAGYRRYCPYTIAPRRDGAYSGPDVVKARRLVDASGTKGRVVRVWASTGGSVPEARYLVSVLQSLGYKTKLTVVDDQGLFAAMKRPGDVHVAAFGFGADFPSAFNFFDSNFSCSSGENLAHFCSHPVEAQIARANALQASDPQAASKRWMRIDREITDQAPWLFDSNPSNIDVVSQRVRNYQLYTPQGSAMLDQMWIR